MEEDEKLEDVTIIDVTFGDEGTYTMMSYLREGVKYISFAYEDCDGIWCFGPFPQHVLACTNCMDDLVDSMEAQGYTLVILPEQQNMVC
jgi:hypothetical protein